MREGYIIRYQGQEIWSAQSHRLCAAGLLDVELADNPVIDVTKKNEFWKYNNYNE